MLQRNVCELTNKHARSTYKQHKQRFAAHGSRGGECSGWAP